MSVSICTSCLSRLRLSQALPSRTALPATLQIQTASFHTSAAREASPIKAKNTRSGGPKHRESQSSRLKKKSRERPKLPPVGERRAQRRRIVLSNTNALEVDGMENWSKENLINPELTGKMMGLNGDLLDQLRDAKAFQRTQNWSLFRRPATLIRNETNAVGQDIEQVNRAQDGKTVKHLVVGEKASGKSILALQTMCMAYMKDWVVLNVPDAQEFTNNTSSYAPLKQSDSTPSADEQLYIQPHLTQQLLTRAVYSNGSVLESLKLNHEVPSSLSLKKKATLKDLAQLGADDHNLAWPVWQAFWRELNEPGANPRPRILFAADNIDHWMGPSKYRNADHEIIHAQQFTLARHFMDLMFSKQDSTPFANGGMIMFSTTGSNTPAHPTFNVLIKQMRARGQGISATSSDFPLPTPYSKPDAHVLELAGGSQNVKLTEVNGLSVPESKAYLEYFVRSGLLQANITEGKIAELRGLSGGGVVGELAKLGSRIRV
ncbi:mitochondrial ribosomal death-associated protein 3-domain-containing protein [Exophiala viscosa]|uniref:Small ribosomal subunit protein mS29 n=1 Tax=Exophiala viscosa TaxID=2486360 RepID=A0AAN6DXM2_9EURO|nr:mitochondrial ribosomal death-associated protein 3-domain-containing protein [Exophiala viscosa]KAI1621419.1 mitochondrial ribosomal death-associated protein 3-domain-containing protein [Exophiala viscosa]